MRIIDVTPSGFAEFLRGGREKAGEDLVVGQFAKLLQDTHVLIRNLTLPDSNEKLGYVLVGPDGIWHLELLHLASLVNSGGVWMHWDYVKQSVQPVPLSTIAEHARSKLAELQAFLAQSGFGARQAVVMTAVNAPHEFNIPGIDLLVFAEEIGEFVKDVMPQYAATTPLAVDAAVNLLTGKTAAPEAAKPSVATAWLNRRYPQLFSLTGLQLLVLGLLALVNCCVLTIFATILFSGS